MRPSVPRLFLTSTFRLSLLYVVLFGVSMLAVLGFIYVATVGNMVRITDETIQREMDDLLDEHRRGGTRRLQSVIQQRTQEDRVGGWVYLLVNQNYETQAGNIPLWPVEATEAEGWLRFAVLRRQEPYRVRALTRALPNTAMLLLVGLDIRPAEKFTETMIQAVAWAVLLTLALGVGGGYVMSRQMLRRLDLINRGAERIMRGQLAARMPVMGTDDEFDRLAQTLNTMLQEIERLIASIRGVTTNLAHDLRSPLTRIKSRLELSLVGEAAEEKLRSEIRYILLETDQLLATFNALLSIAETEGGAARANMKPLDLWEVAVDVAELYGPMAEDRGLYLHLEGQAGARVHGHRQLLLQALLNLVDNAVKYTQSGGVSLCVTEAEGHVVLSVADTGPGIAPEDRARVLEQFVRLDPARTTRGNGLGLSLVAAIARLHDAELALADNDGVGLEVLLKFPAP